VIAAATLAALSERLSAIATSGIDAQREGLLLSALAYYDAGLLYDAARAIDRLAASGIPLSSQLTDLRQSIADRVER
jgi:hypothetical protein